MNITPVEYNSIFSSFSLEYQDARVNVIFDDGFIKSDRSFDIIMDIGCGPGNGTKLMASKVKHNKLIAVDIDPNMISFAEKNNKFSSIDYLIQDFTQPWDQLIPQLRKMENKVEFINGIALMNWIVFKDRVLANCTKLLTSNGHLFIGFGLPDISRVVSEEFKSKTNIEWLSIGSQINYMNQLFTQNGFKITKTIIHSNPIELDHKSFLGWFRNYFGNYQLQFKCKDSVEYDPLCNKYFNYCLDATLNTGSNQLNANAWDQLKNSTNIKIVKGTATIVKFYCIKI